MERSECTRTFILLVFVSAVHLSPDPFLTFGTKGGVAELGDFRGANDSMMYRIYEDGDMLLVNCSQPDSPQLDGYDITCPGESSSFRLNSLTMSQCGDYRVEGRREKNSSVESVIKRLTVCEEGGVDMSREDGVVFVRDGNAVLCEFDSALVNGSSLELYAYHERHFTLALDTSSSLEPLMPHLISTLQVDTNTSMVTLSGFMYSDPFNKFLCTMWRRGQCQQAKQQLLQYVPPVIVTHEKECVTLPCTFRRNLSEEVRWKTPTGYVRISSNQTWPPKVMYMLNGSQTGDYSLNIPSVSQQHTGMYSCGHSHFHVNVISLSVCLEFSPVTVMFSQSESVPMDAHVNDSEALLRVQWFRQKGLRSQMLITEFMDKKMARFYGVSDVRVPEDLVGRVTVFNSSTSLNISNLTADDSGVYTWRVLASGPVCYEGSIRLQYRDPFGVHSPFYRVYGPLLGCVLLGVVAVVIWLKLRSRGGALTPGGQAMEMQDIGEEDVYDDVEEAEDSI